MLIIVLTEDLARSWRVLFCDTWAFTFALTDTDLSFVLVAFYYSTTRQRGNNVSVGRTLVNRCVINRGKTIYLAPLRNEIHRFERIPVNFVKTDLRNLIDHRSYLLHFYHHHHQIPLTCNSNFVCVSHIPGVT
jgi:hypothetical protein